MGAVFSLPWARLDDWRDAPHLLRAAGFLTVALSLAPDAVELSQLAGGSHPRARDGGDARHRGRRTLDALVGRRGGTGPHPDVCGIDSLNVAAAAAIACYALSARGG